MDLNKLTMPLLNIYGKFDHLVPPEACEQLVNKVGSKDTEDICLNTGHIGIYVSSKYQEQFAPKIANWLLERDDIPKKRRVTKKKPPAKASIRTQKAPAKKPASTRPTKKSGTKKSE